MTCTHETRQSIVTHVNPRLDCIIEPAKILVNELEPSHYAASHEYKDYVELNKAFGDYTTVIQNALDSES